MWRWRSSPRSQPLWCEFTPDVKTKRSRKGTVFRLAALVTSFSVLFPCPSMYSIQCFFFFARSFRFEAMFIITTFFSVVVWLWLTNKEEEEEKNRTEKNGGKKKRERRQTVKKETRPLPDGNCRANNTKQERLTRFFYSRQKRGEKKSGRIKQDS